ncbi:uncharacterized protein PG986_010886 [Apiospora aurea]|uniref:Uncharacterized protein n=1 Tax=Apiospora aurea TaxID=335848 RepID=A0ABR1Q3J9_9PEZI
MLLTSSQVSIAISSGIVLLFTTALFLSGYAIQQRTLNDLRKAIRPDPRPSPKVNHYQQPDRFKRSTTELPDGTVVEVNDDGNIITEDGVSEAKADPDAIRAPRMPQKLQSSRWLEVRPTTPEDVALRRLQEQQILKETEEARRRKEVEDEKRKKAELEGPEKPLSRAERRRRIKQDIRDLSQGEGPVYYQRRLW